MKRRFKSYDQAKQVWEAMKKEIWYINFGAKNIKASGEGDQQKIEIKGYASTKDRDRYGDIVEPSAFDSTMENYMENPMLLLQHDPNKQIGVVTSYDIDKTGLFIEGEVKYHAGDQELFDKITNGDLKGFSIGFRIKDLELLEEETDEGTLYTWIIRELELLEISVVTIPANPYTLMKSLDNMIKEVSDKFKDIEPESDGSNSDDEPGETPSEDTPDEEPSDEVEKEELETPSEEEPTDEPAEGNEEPDETEGGKNTEIDNEDEPNNIDESESDEPENDPETDDGSEKPTGDDEKEKEAGFTLKMIEKIVGAKTEAMEKQFQAGEKELRENLQKEFDEKIKAFETENVKMLEGLFDIMKSHGEQIKTVTDWVKNLSSGKGFIYTETKQKDPTGGRDKGVLAKLEAMKHLS